MCDALWKILVKCYDKSNMSVLTLSLLENLRWGLIYFDHLQVCFAGPSMGNSADADQMSPDVALHLGLHC